MCATVRARYAPGRETHHPRRRVGHRGMPRHRRLRRSAVRRLSQAERAVVRPNAQRIQTVIDARGTCSGLPGGRPLAVFDWDNTFIKNDISDQTFFWMLRHDKVRQPPRRDWHDQPLHDARGRRARCGAPAARWRTGEPLPTSTNSAAPTSSCRSARTRRRRGGDPVFAGYDHRRMEGATSGCRIHGRAHAGDRACLAARRAEARAERPQGATQKVGSGREVAWVRYYAQQRDLVRTLNAAGFDTWVVSASPQECATSGAGRGLRRAATRSASAPSARRPDHDEPQGLRRPSGRQQRDHDLRRRQAMLGQPGILGSRAPRRCSPRRRRAARRSPVATPTPT